MNILFWNVHKNKDINNLLAELILENDSDIIGLAEYEADIKNLLTLINKGESTYFIYPIAACRRIQIISKIRPYNKNIGPDENYYRIWQFPYFKGKKINIAFVHIPVLNIKESDKMSMVEKLRKDVELYEKKTKTCNSIIVGDYNMNPFDEPVYSAGGLHAISDSNIAKEISRTVRDDVKYYFYNPMWNMLGDKNRPTGSYYYRHSILDCLFWNVLDQVCIRPSLIDMFDMESLKFITTIGENSLIRNNIPNGKISDHLPLFFKLKEE